ncbi:MAG: hypothetical protein AAFR71_00080 [Pseudomonadota bacterium]
MRNHTSRPNRTPDGELDHGEAVRTVAQHLSDTDTGQTDVAAGLRAKFHHWMDMRYVNMKNDHWRAHHVRRFENALAEATAIHREAKRVKEAADPRNQIAPSHVLSTDQYGRKGGVFFKLGSNEATDAGKTVEVVITAEPVSSDGRAEFAVGYATSGDGESGLCRYRLEEGRNVYSFRCATGNRSSEDDPFADYLGIWPDTNGRGNSVLISDVIVREVTA